MFLAYFAGHQLLHTSYQKEVVAKRMENWRSGTSLFSKWDQTRDIKEICSHHEQELLIKFSTLRRRCCDPLNRHPEKARSRSLQIISMETYKTLVNPPKMLVPEEKVCCDCMISLKKAIVQATGEESCSKINTDVTMAEVDVSVPIEPHVFYSPENIFDLSSTLSGLGETPVKLHSLGSSSKQRKGQQKLISATATLKRKLETVYDVPLDSPESNLTSSADNSDLQLFRSM